MKTKELKKSESEPDAVLEQCPECRRLVVDNPKWDRPKSVPSVVTFGSNIKKTLCNGCVAKFQI